MIWKGNEVLIIVILQALCLGRESRRVLLGNNPNSSQKSNTCFHLEYPTYRKKYFQTGKDKGAILNHFQRSFKFQYRKYVLISVIHESLMKGMLETVVIFGEI